MLHPTRTWYSLARDRLMRLWRDPCGWEWSGQGDACPEPTVLACLALLSSDDEATLPDTLERVDASAQWLADLQRVDGAVGTDDAPAALCRSTAWAALLWGQLLHYRRPLASALRWLQQSDALAPAAAEDELFAQEPALGAWLRDRAPCPTVELAAMAVLSLCRNQLVGHQRITDTLRWILERSQASGGWHAGRAAPSGDDVAPDLGTTGTVLMALRAAGLAETQEVTMACHYMEDAMPHASSPSALSWGLLGYTAWRARPADASQWLGQCFADAAPTVESASDLSLLILADRPDTFTLLGVHPGGARLPSELLLPEFLTV